MTPEELEQIAEDQRAEQGKYPQRVNVCVAAGCLSCQSQSVKDALDQEVAGKVSTAAVREHLKKWTVA